MRKWSIIIFCYNEEAAIYKVVEHSLRFLDAYGSKDAELIIIDDGSTDDSKMIMTEWLKRIRGYNSSDILLTRASVQH